MTTRYRSDDFAEEIQNTMQAMLQDGDVEVEQYFADTAGGIRRVETFEEAMIPGVKGLVVHFNDGSEAQITIVAGRPAGVGEEES